MLDEIDSKSISASKRRQEKLKLLRTQVNKGKKVLKQKINIPFTKGRKQRPLSEIVNDLKKFIAENSNLDPSSSTPPSTDPFFLVGKRINHRFIVESGEEQWFHGFVLSYNANTKKYDLVYGGETEHQYFDLSEDIINGDLEIL